MRDPVYRNKQYKTNKGALGGYRLGIKSIKGLNSGTTEDLLQHGGMLITDCGDDLV